MNRLPGPFDALLTRHGNAPHRLVQILREIQAQQSWLSPDTLSAVASGLGLPSHM